MTDPDPRTAPPAGHVVLIGMPGVGKSTVGVLLAKATGRDFVDTDVVIQAESGQPLAELIQRRGIEGFCRIEERVVAGLTLARPSVIATGGSVVYSEPAMGILKDGGAVVYLAIDPAVLAERLADLKARGVVMLPDQSLASLHAERDALYRAWADVIVPCDGLNQDGVVAEVCRKLPGGAGC